jgi:hypothetical protein
MAELINSSVFNGVTVAVVGSGGGGGGVTKLTSTDGSVSLTPETGIGEVNLSVVYPVPVESVLSLNSLINNITLVDGTNTTVTTNSEANTIAINIDLPANKPFSNNIYVSNDGGDDLTGNGTITNPYKTIGTAITQANTTLATDKISIMLGSGIYTENVSITRPNTFISGGATSISTATHINGTITIDPDISTLPLIIVGVSSVQVNSIVFNNSVSQTQSVLITDCLIAPSLGDSAIVMTDTSTGGNGDITIQNCLIYMSNIIAVKNSNGFMTFINSEIKNNPAITAPSSMVQTSGTGRVNFYGSILTQASALSTVAPIIDLTNNTTTFSMTIDKTTIQYTSAVSDAGTGQKCCIRCANSGSISSIVLFNNLLICQGATTTNGNAGQFVVLQRTGAGTVTVNHGQNSGGSTANHLPANGGGFTKTAYINVA